MIARREFVFGAGCVAAIGASELLRPRTRLTLLPEGEALGTLIPSSFGDWRLGPDGDIVIPETPGSLADKLYSDRVARSYRDGDGPVRDVMFLAAYGGMQSDLLQLHRPETCYPAVGMQIVYRQLTTLPIAAGVAIPIVMLTAKSGSRIEDVIYWTRLGEDMPQTAGDQRMARLMTAMRGYIADGILVRASAIRADNSVPTFTTLRAFMTAMLQAAPVGGRKVLVGNDRAGAIGSRTA